jgi:predicted nucleotide-binding protein (sugar kinase/HSP70/actin superfamily)
VDLSLSILFTTFGIFANSSFPTSSIYQEKLETIKQEIKEVNEGNMNLCNSYIRDCKTESTSGTHEEFEDRIAALEFERDNAIKKAEHFKNYQFECINNIYQSEIKLSDQEYEVIVAKYFYPYALTSPYFQIARATESS